MSTEAMTAAAATFDPRLWLAAFTEIGGGYALMADRKLALLVTECDGEDLTSVMSQIVGDADRQEAVKAAIERRQTGESTNVSTCTLR